MLPRQDSLAALISDHGFLRVADASSLLGVSEVTVRSDLRALERRGLVRRVHGGAMPRSERESSFEQSLGRSAAAKRAIGRATAARVRSGQSVILDVGSTALAVAEALVEREELRDVTVITSGLRIALALEAALPRFTVVVTGGTLRAQQHSLVNPLGTLVLDGLRADLAVIGCNGVDVGAGVTNVNLPEAEIKRSMLGAAARAVVVAESAKLGHVHLGVIGALGEFDELITTDDASAASLSTLGGLLAVEAVPS